MLWTPRAIGGVAIRNRFVLTGHGTARIGRNAFSGAEIALRPFDSAVAVMPGQSRDADAAAWVGRATMVRIGDSRVPRDVEAAILDAHHVARAL